MNQETLNEILNQWRAVKQDRVARRECLENTGPGESPYTQTQDVAWDMREHCLARTLLSAMPELEPVLYAQQTVVIVPASAEL